jgi:hypothetical protein
MERSSFPNRDCKGAARSTSSRLEARQNGALLVPNRDLSWLRGPEPTRGSARRSGALNLLATLD